MKTDLCDKRDQLARQHADPEIKLKKMEKRETEVFNPVFKNISLIRWPSKYGAWETHVH